MFTGIIEGIGRVRSIRSGHAGRRLEVALPFEPALGESIAVAGVCLTWSGNGFDVVPETLARTTLGDLRVGDRVNLERSLKVGDRLGGHFVLGHVDGLGEVAGVSRRNRGVLATVAVSADLGRYLAPKGSVTVDGVSLTLVDVAADRFTVALIPHTLVVTTLGRLARGRSVNVEIDVLARYAHPASRLSVDFLRRAGFA